MKKKSWMTGCAPAAIAAAVLTACAADGAPRPITRVVIHDAETLTRAAVAATRMGAQPQLRQLAGGQVVLVAVTQPAAVMAAAPDVTILAAAPAKQATAATAAPPPAPVATPADGPAQPRAQQASERIREVEQTLQAWRLAWELGDAGTYLRFYDSAFKGDLPSRKAWEAQRRSRLANAKIAVKVEKLQAQLTGDDVADLRFVQHYSSGRHRDVGEKHLRMQRVGGAWRIVQETWSAKN